MSSEELLDKGMALPKKPSIENAKEIIKLRRSYKEQFRKTTNGRYAIIGLLVIMGIAAVYEMVVYDFEMLLVVINLSILAILAGIYIYSLKQPYYAFITAIVGLILLSVLSGLEEPINMIKGLLWKGVILYFLIVGLSPAKNLKDTVSSLMDYGVDIKKT